MGLDDLSSSVPSAARKPKITNQSANVAEQLQRSLRVLMILTIALYIAFAGVVFWAWTQSNRNTKALCALRVDAQARVETNRLFLMANPEGIRGVSIEQLQRSTDNAVRTANALKIVHCN